MFMSYVHKKSTSPKATFFICRLEGSEILDNSSKLFWSGTFGFTTLTSVFDNLHLSPAEIESFHCRQIVNGCFLVKNYLITVDNFMEISSLPDKFKCWPYLVQYFLSKSVSNILTLLYIFSFFSNCLLNFITSLLTHDEGIRSCLWGNFITKILTLFYSTKLHTCFIAALVLFLLITFAPPILPLHIHSSIFLFNLFQRLQLHSFWHLVLQN
jgi:hypothetical protein